MELEKSKTELRDVRSARWPILAQNFTVFYPAVYMIDFLPRNYI